MYADDTALYYASNDESDLKEKINEDMTSVVEWLNQNKLSLNVEKTEFILLGTKSKLRNIHDDTVTVNINGTHLSVCTTVNTLELS